jgi:SAM domain (Sterile alpha motif)
MRERDRSGEAVVDIAAWLSRLGLQQYEPAFRENDVDAEVLPELTAEDLIGLGVTSIGHRRKLLAAITALGKPAADNSALATVPGPADAPDGSVSLSPERPSSPQDRRT